MRAANKRNAETDEKGRRRDAAARARRLAKKNADAMPAAPKIDGPRQVRVVDADMVEPAPRGGVLEVLQQPYVLKLIVQRQLANMYAASMLGLLWSYIQPAMRFGIYYLVMGFILKLHEGYPYFAIHLFVGIVCVHYFSETWGGGTRSIWQNRALVQKLRVPREVFPVSAMVVAAYHTIPQVLVLVICCLIAGWHLTWSAVAAGVLGTLILATFSMAMALFFSAINVFARDFQNIVTTVLQFMHFLVPMMYPFGRVYDAHETHPWLYEIYMANPVTQAVLMLQRFFWWGLVDDSHKAGVVLKTRGGGTEFPPDMFERGLITLAVCALLLYLAQRYFSRVEGKFAERL